MTIKIADTQHTSIEPELASAIQDGWEWVSSHPNGYWKINDCTNKTVYYTRFKKKAIAKLKEVSPVLKEHPDSDIWLYVMLFCASATPRGFYHEATKRDFGVTVDWDTCDDWDKTVSVNTYIGLQTVRLD